MPAVQSAWLLVRGVSALTVGSMLVLCDLDATLLDRGASYARWARGLATSRGLDPAAASELVSQITSLAAKRPGAAVIAQRASELVEGAGGAPVRFEEFKEGFARAAVLAEGVGAALSKLRSQGCQIAVVTNGEEHLQRLKIAASGLEALVDEVVISEAEGVAKPDPALLEIAAARCGQSLQGAWMVGDQADTDIQAAAAAGIPSVWVDHGASWTSRSCVPTRTASGCAKALEVVSRQLLPAPRRG